MVDKDSPWFARHQVTGRAQSRYLWVMLLTALFFFVLALGGFPDPVATLPVPLLRVNVPSLIVWATGPTVLSFLVLMLMGALRAHTTSREHLEIADGEDVGAEAADQHPNAQAIPINPIDAPTL